MLRLFVCMMQSLSSIERQQNLLRFESEYFDVLVIGGGITGAGVALDAAARGYKVALVEKSDFASGTSSKSTKLIHGGIRYLSNFDFALVHEALTERGLLLRNAPFLVQPLPFILPIYKGDRHPVGIPFTTPGGIGLSNILNTGLWFYDILAGSRNVDKHRYLSHDQVLKLAPTLMTVGLKEGFIYYDAQTNDARLTIALLRTAVSNGANIANYAEVTSLLTKDGKVCGASISDQLSKQEIILRAKHVVNATGIFSEQIEALVSKRPQIQIEPSKGVHLVFSRDDIPLDKHAIVLPQTDDKRILFLVPWESRVLFGTTDTGPGDPDHPTVTHQDIAYLLSHLNRYLSMQLTTANIVSTYAGYRPLIKARNSRYSNAKLSRTHAILQSPTGLISIVGGKLTTYRRMAQDTVDVLNRRDGSKLLHPTQNLPLLGSSHWPELPQKLELQGATLGLDTEIIAHLGKNYGSEALSILSLVANDVSLAKRLVDDLPFIRAEVSYACHQEMAMTPYDILARRTSIQLQDRQRGLGIVDDVTALMAQELHWSYEQQQAMIEAYRLSIKQYMAAEARE